MDGVVDNSRLLQIEANKHPLHGHLDQMISGIRRAREFKEITSDTRVLRKFAKDAVTFNRAIAMSWPLFSVFLITQPWMANLTNNNWWTYSAEYDVYGDNGSLESASFRTGMCNTAGEEMHCTNGANFTELALKYRGQDVGCGCGEGVYGEGLCPMTMYGYTLSDYVSSPPALGAMLGLGFFPLMGTWMNTAAINKHSKPSPFEAALHFNTMLAFQISYIMWGIASACIFPTAHATLTVVFLGAFLAHWCVSAKLVWKSESKDDDLEAYIVGYVAVASIVVIALGAIPRVLLTMNGAMGTHFPNLNRGIGAYAFWFAEACGLSLTFGAYPLILYAYNFRGEIEERAIPKEFMLFYEQYDASEGPQPMM